MDSEAEGSEPSRAQGLGSGGLGLIEDWGFRAERGGGFGVLGL